MGHRLFAVLVRATVTNIDAHLARSMRPVMRSHTIDGSRLGGQVTGAWDADLAGVVWLGTDEAVLAGTDTGHIPPRLRAVLDDLLAGRRDPDLAGPVSRRRPTPADWSAPWWYPGRPQRPRARFNPADWSVAVVDAHS